MKNKSVKIFLACMFIGLIAGFMYAGAKKTSASVDGEILHVDQRVVTKSEEIDQNLSDKKAITQEGTSNEIKFERSVNAKTGTGLLQKKLIVEDPLYIAEQYPYVELHPVLAPDLDILPHDASDAKVKSVGKSWSKPDENLYVKGEMLIQLENPMRDRVLLRTEDGVATFNITEIDELNTRFGVAEISRVIEEDLPQGKEFGLDLIFLMKVPEELDLEIVSQEYRYVSGVKEVSPNYLPFKHETDNIPRTIPNDPYYDWSDSIVKAPECWAIPEYGSNSIIISILDIERLYETHPDLSGNYLGMKGGITGTGDHGTMCASVACARLNNSTGMSGLCGGWNTTQGVRWTGYVFTSAADNITGITWSVSTANADILSESIGFGGNPAGLESSFEWAWSQGVISFASAGNDAANPEPGWPAYYGIIIAVGGCDADGKLWDWGTGTGSNIGEWVDIIAPGDAQYCCDATSYTNSYGGTSFATPAVAAIAGLMWSDNPSLTPTQIRERLIRAADYNEHKSPEYAGLMGAGISNCYESVEIYNTNVSVNEIIDVGAAPPAYTSIWPKAVVQNRGTSPATFNVVAEARQLGVVYADTVQVSNLPPNNEYKQNAEIVEFEQWNPSSGGIHTFRVFSTMTGDQNRVNDTLQITINVVPPSSGGIDTLVYETSSPAWYFSDANFQWAVRCSPAQPCSVLSINFYGYGTGNYQLYTWNDASGIPGTVNTGPQTYYNPSDGWKNVDITGHPYFTGDFHIGFQCPGGAGGPWVITDNGPGSGRSAYSADGGSSWNIFNTYNWCIRAIVQYPPSNTHDVSTQSIVVPTTHEITAMPVIPTAIIKNLGASTETGFNVTVKIDSSGTEVYTDTKSISKTMGKYDTDTVAFAGWMPNWEGGTYNTRCYTQLGTDQDLSNDTLIRDVLCSNIDTLAIDDGTSRWYSGDSFYAGARFTIERPAEVTGIMYYMWRRRGANPTPDVVPCTLFVWDNASGDPGTQLHDGEHTPTAAAGEESSDWWTYNMSITPVALSPGDFWVGIWTPGMVGYNNPGTDSTFEYILFDNDSETYRTKTSDDKTTWNTRTIDCMIRPIIQYTGSVNSHDVMSKEIDEPGTIVSTLYDYPVEAQVKNVGAGTETFDVYARITESGGPQVYLDNVSVSSFAPGETRSVSFADWQPTKPYDYYDLTVYTTLGSDVDRSNDTLVRDSIFSTPNDIVWYDNGVSTYYWGDSSYRYTAVRFSHEAPGWLIGAWVAMESDVTPWPECSIFVWDDNDGWNDGGLPDPSVEYVSGPVTFDPGGTGAYWLYVTFTPVYMDTTSDFFICFWNALPPFILLDDTTTTYRSFCADVPTNDWQPVASDYMIQAVMRYDYNGAPPKPAYIYAQKNATKDSIIVYWDAVTLDTLDNPTAIDWYEIYSNTDPSYIPSGSDWLQSPFDTFMIEALPGVDRNYLNYPTSVYLQVGDKSNMGYALYKFFNENTGATSDRNWVSLPWHSEYSTVQDLTDDLSPSGDPLLEITNLRDDQLYESWVYDDFFGWFGTDFAITPGKAYEMVTSNDTILVIVGSNNPDGTVTLNENASATSDRNWVSIPYNAVYSTVSDITTEYSPTGDPLIEITNLRDDQLYESWVYDDFFGWFGVDFSVVMGRGYEFVTIVDTVWDPTEYSNRAFTGLTAKKQVLQTDVELTIGYENSTDRKPVWTIKQQDLHSTGGLMPDIVDAQDYTLSLSIEKTCKVYHDPGIPHIVLAELDVVDCEDIVFTAYRLAHPQDVLTEEIIGCGVVRKDDKAGIWFNTGNFLTPWKDKEEVIVIIEAFTAKGVLWNAIAVNLDKGVDIQHIGSIELYPMPALEIYDNRVSWNSLDCDLVVGYSVYRNEQRMNNEVLIKTTYSGNTDLMVRPVIKGGFETVNGIQSRKDAIVPISYSFSMYPNPVVNQAHIQYALPVAATVDINVYDVAGKLVRTLVSEQQDPGFYDITWNSFDDRGRNVAAGVYFVQMQTSDYISKNKIILVR